MTDTLTTNDTENATPANILVHIHPGDLQVETNVRTEASLSKQFVTSIKENGVLVPIVAVRDADGIFHVRMGQRRTLAAREAGLTSVPVYVTESDTDTATRLVEQITENDQRLALSGTDRVAGIQQLLDTGLTVSKVAKRLAVSPERVKQSKAVAESTVAMEALTARTVTLEQAASLAEFEDDADAVERLNHAIQRNYFDQEVARLRKQREDTARLREAAVSWEALGYTVLDRWPGYDSGQVPLDQLLDADGYPATEAAITDPLHWSVTLTEDSVFYDAEGALVDESLIDWSTEDNPDGVPEDGMVHINTVTEKKEFVPLSYYCHDPVAAGLAVTERWAKLTQVSASLPDGAPMPETSEDLKRKAAERAERRRVIALNKAGEAAESVRREFVKSMVGRKTPPKGAMLFVATTLLSSGSLLGSQRGDDVASDLLGANVRGHELLGHDTSDGRAEVVLLGTTLGMLESLTPKSAWRGPSGESAAYLRFLAQNGYGLSPVEQVIVGDMSADAAYEELGEGDGGLV